MLLLGWSHVHCTNTGTVSLHLHPVQEINKEYLCRTIDILETPSVHLSVAFSKMTDLIVLVHQYKMLWSRIVS